MITAKVSFATLLLISIVQSFLWLSFLTFRMLSKQVDLAVELLEDLLGIIQVCAHWKLSNAGNLKLAFDACNLVHLYPTHT